MFFFAGVIAGFRSKTERRVSLFLVGFTGLYAAYIAKVGGDNLFPFPYWRHFVHISPFLFLGAAAGVVSFARGRIVPAIFVSLVCVGTADAVTIIHHLGGRMKEEITDGIRAWPGLEHASHNEFYRWIDDHTSDDTIIAASLAGELAYVVDATHMDTLGLNNSWIARNGTFDPDGPQDSKSDMKWVMEQRPDMVECYMSGRDILDGATAKQAVNNWRRKMCVEMLTSPIFLEEYLFVTNAPYSVFDRALFVRRDWWESSSFRNSITCMPVSETTMGQTVDELIGGTP